CGQRPIEQGKVGPRVACALDPVPRVDHWASAQDGGAGWLDEVGAQPRVGTAERPGYARERAAGSNHVNEHVDLSPGLFPELGPRVSLMGQDVGLSSELIDAEGAALLHDLSGFLLHQGEIIAGDLAVDSSVGLVDDDDLCAKGLHLANSL